MSENDILTAQKNHVIATNSLNQTWGDYLRAEHGTETSLCVDKPTMITIGSGRLVAVSVVVGGTASGFIYNEDAIDAPAASGRLMAIPKTEGVYTVNFIFKTGLLVSPGEGQAVTVTYAVD